MRRGNKEGRNVKTGEEDGTQTVFLFLEHAKPVPDLEPLQLASFLYRMLFPSLHKVNDVLPHHHITFVWQSSLILRIRLSGATSSLEKKEILGTDWGRENREAEMLILPQ
ncbi:uncharacterized protein [Ovis canadensis]|uniref:uncharacterized protein isoform X3 n=1 Tax=Ovis canadensis TaxID=37174 RepID=UPI0037525165